MRTLARSPHLAGLRRLEIEDYGEGSCLPALLEAPWLPSLRELRLVCQGTTDDAMEGVAGCAALSRLRVLSLGRRFITRGIAEALARSPHLGGLLSLDIWVPADRSVIAPLVERFGGRFVGYWPGL
jgi:hypothetical protein